LADWVTYDSDITKQDQLLLCDAQTSGGLLAAIPANRAESLLKALHARGIVEAAVIGQIEGGTPSRIMVSR
jgi:selenide, water dikinase